MLARHREGTMEKKRDALEVHGVKVRVFPLPRWRG
jgi:hypothetical protein